ncbi:triose-phosphate isomerase [Streptomyces hainanensis]|uniref:Triosephosphate isomerase n=1 Tax=Streptomyces hainanensis TaxID=402648 RepID=A0A4V2Y455_9ACTN|nr:triose-phosphate isomerase [Streptomyces hainanensis]TDC79085.1 triose-phosphate isomerase [Streptomyces hainanensis]
MRGSVRWLGTSFKMTKTIAESTAYAARLRDAVGAEPPSGVRLFVIPPATAIEPVARTLGTDSPVLVGAQNAHWADEGAWTGEISMPQAADAGARIVEIGHSERRAHFAETDATVRLKVAAALRHGLVPLVCVGEDAATFAAGRSADQVVAQATAALDGLAGTEAVLLAYEPVWAIGEHGRPAGPAEVAEPVAALRAAVGGRIGGVLYGGSVSPANAAGLLDVPGVDGLFVGRAAWRVAGFLALLELTATR